jgi:ferredoxin-NADP reductase
LSQGLYRRLVVKSVVTESESAKSFYLVSEDGSDLAPHLPGQHLPIRLEIPGQARTVFRCYTISNFDNSCYRLSIKKELPPPDRADVSHGVSSGYFHDLVKPGMTIEAKTPAGNFWLDLDRNHPVVMIAGGIGVTPMMSMLEALARTRSRRNVYFFFGLRHSADHVFKDRLNEITRECTGLRMKIYYEAARPGDVHGRDYHATGRIDLKEVRSSLPAVNMEYFLCGPPPMLNAISSGLVADGVARENIRTETFGPSSVALRDLISSDEVARSAFQQAAGVTVTFKRSAVSVPWTGEVPSLLQLAEANGVEISSGCQYGDCGTCMTRLLEGKVKYLHPTGARPDPGHCLPCSCEPDGPISLDV